jgi:chromosome segregation ATPase
MLAVIRAYRSGMGATMDTRVFDSMFQQQAGLETLRRQLAAQLADPSVEAELGNPLKHAAEETLEAVARATEAFRANEQRARTAVQHAAEELAGARAHIRALEARALKAEVRAKEAERWLLRVQQSVAEMLVDWQPAPAVDGDDELRFAA